MENIIHSFWSLPSNKDKTTTATFSPELFELVSIMIVG